jgi:signal transduction histidine kinase
MIIDDINGDSPLARALYETAEIPLQISFSHARSWIGIPLVVKDRVIGLLSLTHNEPGYYTQQHARLALTIANQVAVAIENARLYEQAHNLAALEERQRIARELHDSVTQLLYGIRLYSTAASHSIRENNLRQVEQDLVEIKDNALQALQEMRLLIFELHPPMLKEAGLVAALQTSLDSVEARTGLQTDLKVEAGITRLPTSIEVELFRIAMEALNNLVKYARAKRVTVDLRYTDERVYMDICDNGVGFDLSAAKLSNGLGLRNMEERARRMGANLRITSEPGIGTQVKVDVRIADKVNLN